MKQLFTLGIVLLSSTFAWSQVQGDGGTPKTKSYVDTKTIDHRVFSRPDVEALEAEDAMVDGKGIAPWRFGYNNEVNLNMQNSGSWKSLPNGGKVWMLHVTCTEALTVNLTFSDLQIPEGNELYVYNADKSFILGKFTAYHTFEGQLGTELIPGEDAIVEYYVAPQNAVESARLTLNTVTHGYRTAEQFYLKAFGSSGSCNMNVNCPDGATWGDQKKGAVMLVSGSNGFCSGSMINNTQNDGKPYVLTANHCYSNPASWIFRFHWESATCANPGSSPTFQSLSGAVLRARRTPSDFCLVEITGGLVGGTVPSSLGTYFSGWDNTNTPPTASVSIHHPAGDIKKISFDDNPAVAVQAMGSSEPASSWQVVWDRNTTTEGGSSGSPLFNQNRLIIGQLWGGGASCTNLSAPDYYGRLYNSWEPAGSNSTNQLKFWLDPTNSGVGSIPGMDPNGSPAVLDASVSNDPSMNGTICQSTVAPSVTITNLGSATLTSLTINYSYDGGTSTAYNWTGSLAQFGTTTVNLPTSTLSGGAHTFDVTISNPNAGVDENNINDASSSSFFIVTDNQSADFVIDLDCYSSETSWELTEDVSGATMFVNPGYADGAPGTQTYSFCLNYGCYTLTLNDSYGDGLTNCNAANGGNGSYQILGATGNVLAELTEANADFGFQTTSQFCIVNTADVAEIAMDKLVAVYPNPATDILQVHASGLEFDRVELLNVAGQVVVSAAGMATNAQLNVANLDAGVYLVRVQSAAGVVTKSVVIQ